MRSKSIFDWLVAAGAIVAAVICCAGPLVLAATGLSLAALVAIAARVLPAAGAGVAFALLVGALIVRWHRAATHRAS